MTPARIRPCPPAPEKRISYLPDEILRVALHERRGDRLLDVAVSGLLEANLIQFVAVDEDDALGPGALTSFDGLDPIDDRQVDRAGHIQVDDDARQPVL